MNNLVIEESFEDKHMSIVGLKICTDGILAFADSKGTLKRRTGEPYVDNERESIQKIFRNENFIVATYGPNQILTINGLQPIESILQTFIQKYSHPFDFFSIIQASIADSTTYYFILGEKDSEGYYVRYISVSAAQMTIGKKLTIFDTYCGGDERYFPFFCMLNNRVKCMEAYEIIKCGLTSEIKKFDEKLRYNPCGMPVIVEMFQK